MVAYLLSWWCPVANLTDNGLFRFRLSALGLVFCFSCFFFCDIDTSHAVSFSKRHALCMVEVRFLNLELEVGGVVVLRSFLCFLFREALISLIFCHGVMDLGFIMAASTHLVIWN
jgi:hypothetical protein